jgi:uncharacterized membrane protein
LTAELSEVVLLAQVASTLFMTGLIWFVQVVHYPLLAQVGRQGFADYEAAHVRLTTWVVAPAMLTEALTSVLLVWRTPERLSASACWVGLGLVVVIWSSTLLLQVPRHNALAAGFDAEAHHSLVLSNWIRTAAWTARGFLVLVFLGQAVVGGSIDV